MSYGSKMTLTRSLFILFVFVSLPLKATIWGFYAHQMINRMAVFTLPPEMIGFYKHHIEHLTENAINPDRRRYAVKDEAARHYIDIDVYGDSAVYQMPRYWDEAIRRYPEDTLKKYGIVPWHVNKMRYRLTDAMRVRDTKLILRLSTDLGHYIADANVPLHTTENYNGQLTDQKGIHGLWESRLTELFAHEYDYFVGKADYLERPQLTIWNAVVRAHEALDTVLVTERRLTEKFGEDKKYGFETRGNKTVKTYSFKFSQAYHRALNGMVERQMAGAVKMVGDFWYTCWIDAGQPDLNELINVPVSDEELKERYEKLEEWKQERFENRRAHENDLY